MKDLKYLGSRTGEYVGDLNDVRIVTDADWAAAAQAALLNGADPTAVAAAVANKDVAGSDLLGISAVGDLQFITGPDRLKQDVTKILLTERGLNPYPNYGTVLAAVIGSNPANTGILNFVADDVLTALRYQAYLETSSDQNEVLGQIKQLDVEFSRASILITLQLETAARTAVNLEFEV